MYAEVEARPRTAEQWALKCAWLESNNAVLMAAMERIEADAQSDSGLWTFIGNTLDTIRDAKAAIKTP